MTDSTVATFGAAFALSLTYSLVPGPVTVEALRRGAQRGVRAVVSVRLGSLAGSLAWALAGLTGAGVVVQNSQFHLLLTGAGTAFLLLLAWRALLPTGSSVSDRAGARHSDTLAGAMIAIANPLAAVFWLGISGSLLSSASTVGRIAQASAFVAGFIAAHLLSTAVFAAVVGCGRCAIGGRLTRAASVLCVAPLAWFALSPLLRAI